MLQAPGILVRRLERFSGLTRSGWREEGLAGTVETPQVRSAALSVWRPADKLQSRRLRRSGTDGSDP